ncbi:hypothetical protein P692DRAFT_20239264, partial [Suillus brevipes Sb2]
RWDCPIRLNFHADALDSNVGPILRTPCALKTFCLGCVLGDARTHVTMCIIHHAT